MSDDQAVFRDALIREGVSLAVLALAVWYLGPGKIIVNGWRLRAQQVYRAPRDRIDTEVAKFRAEVSRWEHEQAAQ